MNNRKLTDAIIHFGGVVTAAWQQGHTEDWVEKKIRRHLMRAVTERVLAGTGGVEIGLPESGTLRRLQGETSKTRKRCQSIGIITLGVKTKGKRSAGKPHATFDEA